MRIDVTPTALTKKEQIDKVHAVLMRELGEKHNVDFIPFHSEEEISFMKAHDKSK